ncbi:MAG TPA: PVC-type heme-binding CxxCH protein, partial [Planctomycetota bacterium]|nr:PVC-type heme-binding CxxCH protein [Planctomycetota bacterium]
MLILLMALLGQDLQEVDDLGLRVARGFRVTAFSDHALANDLYCMTFDARGKVVVSSQHWIKRLHDDDGDGRADRAEELAQTGNGAMGLCFVGNDLYASVDGGVRLFRDADGDGRFDGPSELLFKLSGGEHGVHAIRKGPDGRMYVIAGNDAKVTKEHVTTETSPVRDPEAGALIRFSADGREREILAHGFRNPYDFDFNAAGDIFTYDSDCERDYFLPWYTPTRLYHVAIGMHHGWRLPGWMRSYARRDYQADTVPMLVAVGRGSPTGVVCYRHAAFPERYRGGVFYADWTFGKVYFTPLVPEGASYKPGLVEVFLQPTGTEGFAPTDLAVGPDGALFVSIGGRRTRGAVYRVAPEKPSTTAYSDPPLPVKPEPDPAHPELRVRQAAALAGKTGGESPQARLTAALAAVWRGERPVEAVLAALEDASTPDLRLQAVRLLQLCLGDTNLAKPAVEVHSDYAPVLPPDPAMLPAVRKLFPSGDERLDVEVSRLLAMLEDEDPATVVKTAAFITATSHPTRDVHVLIVLSRLKGAWPDGLAARVAGALLDLGRKLDGLEMRPKQVWGARLSELVGI